MLNPAKIPELIQRMNGALTFKKTEPPQLLYTIKNQKQKIDLLGLTAQILEQMKILKMSGKEDG